MAATQILRAFCRIYKRKTGCSRVKIFDHTIRCARWGMDSQTEGLGPALRVHVDQSRNAAVQRVIENMGEDAERLLKGRYQIVNLWRPLAGPGRRLVSDIESMLARNLY